jgi:hypothetical protein
LHVDGAVDFFTLFHVCEESLQPLSVVCCKVTEACAYLRASCCWLWCAWQRCRSSFRICGGHCGSQRQKLLEPLAGCGADS